jgi:hypothetical protein
MKAALLLLFFLILMLLGAILSGCAGRSGRCGRVSGQRVCLGDAAVDWQEA